MNLRKHWDFEIVFLVVALVFTLLIKHIYTKI